MGLDSYFYFPGSKDQSTWPKVDISVNLCGGLFSGEDNGKSFRGKVYDGVIGEVTNGRFTLYVEEQGNDVVLGIAQALEEALKAQPDRQEWVVNYSIPRREIEDLAKAFRAFGDAGYGIAGWWFGLRPRLYQGQISGRGSQACPVQAGQERPLC